MNRKLKIAVIGYGHLGKWHCQKVECFPEQAELHAIVEPYLDNQIKAREAHRNTRVVEKLSDCIDEIDAAFVVTPTSLHFSLVEELLKNNKHVFCEKPITTDGFEAKKIKEILKSHPVVLQVGHSERFHEVWEWKDRYKEDYLKFYNQPGRVELKRVAPFKGRATDVDVISDLMIHDLDLLMYLFNHERPQSVCAQGFKIRTNHYDYVAADFKYKSGLKATIISGRNQTSEVRELEVVNPEGTLLIDLMRNEVSLAAKNATAPEFVSKKSYPKRDHLLLEHKCFYHSILNAAPPIVTIDDGIIALDLIDAVKKSLIEGCEVML